MPSGATTTTTVSKDAVPHPPSVYSIPTPTRASDSRPFLQDSSLLSGEFLLQKQQTESNKNAQKIAFPDKFRDLLKRKQNVNLYISGGKVVWQFAFNEQVKDAIKTHIKGRQWEPSVGPKGSWTCPLESLPEAISLYEHLGRTPDAQLKQRSREIITAHGGASAADCIKLIVHLIRPNLDSALTIGRVLVSFQYDADVVSTLKQLAPPSRSYDPGSKEWTIDLFSLPEFLHHLSVLDYAPSTNLKDVAKLVEEVESLLSESHKTSTSCVPAKDHPGPAPSVEHAAVESREVMAASCMADHVSTQDSSISHDSPKQEQQLEAVFKSLKQMLQQSHGKECVGTIDRSDCVAAKRRRLTSSQINYSLGGLDAVSDSECESDFLDFSWVRGLSRAVKETFNTTPNVFTECSCGQPWRRVGGQHVCRFFGHFECRCGKRWTSAYCWDGEKQACRSCNQESFPYQKDVLDGRGGGGAGPHDSSRCSMCARLGRDCSERFAF